MKYLYYGFGGFIGFVCGLIIEVIFVAVENSGHPILTNLGRNYGVVGRYLIVVFNALHFFGIVVGIVLVHFMFAKRFNGEPDGGDESSSGD